jgi:hypothetical protein
MIFGAASYYTSHGFKKRAGAASLFRHPEGGGGAHLYQSQPGSDLPLTSRQAETPDGEKLN